MQRQRRWPKGTWMKLTSPDTLRALMRQKGFSYDRLARYVGCHKSFIGALVNPNPKYGKRSCSARVAERIAEALDVPLEILFVPGPSTDSARIPSPRRKAASEPAPNGSAA